jgi:hypothetical protein
MVRLRLHDPSLAPELASFLRRCQCEVRQLGPTVVGVGLGHGVDPEAAARRLQDGLCIRCGGPIEPVLFRLGSPQCHDCRDGSADDPDAAIDTWARMEVESYLRIWRLRNPGAEVELMAS